MFFEKQKVCMITIFSKVAVEKTSKKNAPHVVGSQRKKKLQELKIQHLEIILIVENPTATAYLLNAKL